MHKVKKSKRIPTEIIRFSFTPFLRLKYKYKFDKRSSKGIKRPCLILANHATTLDPVCIGDGFNFGINYVASDSLSRLKFLGKFINWFIAPIPKAKSVADVSTIMNIMNIIKKGGSVCIFPEGNRTLNGATVSIPNGIGKLCKKLNAPVVLVRIENGYLTKPRWGKRVRRGKMSAHVERVISVEEKAGLSAEEIERIVRDTLTYNVWESQKHNQLRFKDKKRAEDIEHVLFLCPDCKKHGTIYSKREKFKCLNCGMEMEYSEQGWLVPINCKHKFTDILEWDKWQIEYVKKFDFSTSFQDEPISVENDVVLFDVNIPGKRKRIGVKGVLSTYKDRVVYTCGKGKKVLTKEFNISDIRVVTIQGKVKPQIYLNDDSTFMFKLMPKSSAYKFMTFVYKLKAESAGEEMTFYGI